MFYLVIIEAKPLINESEDSIVLKYEVIANTIEDAESIAKLSFDKDFGQTDIYFVDIPIVYELEYVPQTN